MPRASQATAFGLMSLCWGLGTLAGPMIGGSLAAPCSSALRVEALCREGSLLVQRWGWGWARQVLGLRPVLSAARAALLPKARVPSTCLVRHALNSCMRIASVQHACPAPPCRPYFLPCLVAGLLSAVATVMTVGWLDETLPSRRRAAGAAERAGAGASSAARYQRVPAADERSAAGPAGSSGAGDAGGRAEVELGGLPPLSPSSSSEWQGGDGKAGGGLTSGGSDGQGGDTRLRAFRGDSARMSLGRPGAVAPSKGQLKLGGGGGAPGSMQHGGSSSSVSALGSLQGDESEEELELELGLGGAADKERAALLDSPSSLAAGTTAAEPQAASDRATPEPYQPWHKLKAVRLSLLGYGEHGGHARALVTCTFRGNVLHQAPQLIPCMCPPLQA